MKKDLIDHYSKGRNRDDTLGVGYLCHSGTDFPPGVKKEKSSSMIVQKESHNFVPVRRV